MSSQSKMVTLVHGTWARNAAWTQEGSPLCAAIKKQGYEVARLPWASWNRFTTRRAAAADLRKHLDNHSDFNHFIIAHSHGGNVALRALDGDDNLVKGLVCLNTPFLNILGRDPEILKSIVIFTLVAASLIPFGLWLGYDFGWSALLWYVGIIVVGALLAVSFGAVYRFIQSKGKKFHFKPLKCTPVYCLNTPDDEAFGFLAFLASAQNFVFLLISRSVVNSQLFGVVIAALLILEALPFLYVPWEWFTDHGLYTRALLNADNYSVNQENSLAWMLVPIKLFALFFISVLYYAGAYLLLMLSVLMILSIIVTISQGFFAPLSGLFNRFIVSLKPLNSINTEFSESVGDTTSLRHSSLYNDKKTINHILAWMEAKDIER